MLQIAHEVADDGRTIVTVAGQVDLATAPQLAEALAQARRERAGSIVLDLAGVDFLDSAGVRVLVEAARRTTGTLSLRGAQGWVAKVLDITGVQDYLNPPEPSSSADQPGPGQGGGQLGDGRVVGDQGTDPRE